MALTSSTIWEVETGGSDSLNGGAFDPSQTAGMLTDGAATSANTASPVFTSASYNFVASDVGAWVYIASGTSWTPGWYKIASVASNAATLSAAIGAAVLATVLTPTVAAGCATTASPTGATWTIDYSQQAAAQFAYTDLASPGAGLTVSSSAHPFGKQQVGNSIVVTSGTSFTTGRYVIASVSGTTATVIGPGNITSGAGSGGHGGLGGALATYVQAITFFNIVGTTAFVQSGTYTRNASTFFPANGSTGYTGPSRLIGYGTVRGDTGRPTIRATSSTSLFTISSGIYGISLENLIIDGNNVAGSSGILIQSIYVTLIGCKFSNFPSGAISVTTSGSNGIRLLRCEITGCATFGFSDSSSNTITAGILIADCWIHDNTCTAISQTSTIGGGLSVINNLITNNTGVSSDGISYGWQATIRSNTIYGNGRDAIRMGNGYTAIVGNIEDNIIDSNGGYGINMTAAGTGSVAQDNSYNFFHGNTLGLRNNLSAGPGDVTLSGDPFTSKSTNDFSLNNNAGAGAACRGAGYPGTFPGGTTVGYRDAGAVQHKDPGALLLNPGMSGGMS